MKKIYEFLDKININSNDVLVIAVSYGPDSMFLLDMLKKRYSKNKIVCAHVHHNHRKESDDEEKLLRKYCYDNDIIFEFYKIEKYTNDTFTEIEARKKRYSFFEKVIKKYKAKYLFTAHHGDDLIETILMKIVRGSTMRGYAGINLVSNRDGYEILRPLLYLTKEDILSYCDSNNIPYAVDNTNLSNDYTRNRYRNNILPYLKKENKDVHLKFLEFSKQVNDYNDFVDISVKSKYNDIINNNEIDIVKLTQEDDIIIRKIIEEYLFNIYKEDIVLINGKHINQIIGIINNKKSNLKVNLPNKIILFKSYNKIFFDTTDKYNDYCYLFEEEVLLPNGYVIRKTNELKSKSNYQTAFCTNDIKFPLYVRTKKEKDKIAVLNLNGTKKVKDIFIDEKIDINARKAWPLLVDKDDNVIWIPGLKKSKYDKSKSEKYDIILEYVKEESNETK